MRKKLKWVGLILALIFIGLQFTTPAHTNPPFNEAQALEGTTVVPADVSALFARSCNDCHSNKTNWRWYTYVAPVSWFTVGHVKDGRAELNFSEWGGYGVRLKETRLKAICDQCQRGNMPLASYARMHREVLLSPDEVKRICDWSAAEGRRLALTHP
jgi:heme-binding protein